MELTVTQASAVRGSTDLHSLLSRVGVHSPIRGYGRQRPRQWPPTLALSWHPLPYPGNSTPSVKENVAFLNSRAGHSWQRVYQDALGGSLKLGSIHFTFRFPGKKIHNSLGNFFFFFKYIHCHFSFIRKKFQVGCSFQTRKGLTFSLLARCFSSRSWSVDKLSMHWAVWTNHH